MPYQRQCIDRRVVIAPASFDKQASTKRLGEPALVFQARRSISALLENFARNPDPGSVYPAMIRGLDLPAESRP